MPQIYDMGPTALFPLRRKACWGFFHPKNPTASAGFEPANLGTKGQHATPRPPKPLPEIKAKQNVHKVAILPACPCVVFEFSATNQFDATALIGFSLTAEFYPSALHLYRNNGSGGISPCPCNGPSLCFRRRMAPVSSLPERSRIRAYHNNVKKCFVIFSFTRTSSYSFFSAVFISFRDT